MIDRQPTIGEKTCIVRLCRAMNWNANSRRSLVAPVICAAAPPRSSSTDPRLSISTPNGANRSRVISCTARRTTLIRRGSGLGVGFTTPAPYPLPIYFAEHDVERADDGDDVGDEVAEAHLPQCLQVDQTRRAHA